MTATFGCLDSATLRLKPGMNWIVAPNEWGKSTWCAFLTAMFYGIDTRERSGRDYLADKERYAPWSGKPMEGIVHLEHEGRKITIQRRTKGRIPMGEFLAYDTATGIPIRELTTENCGQMLLGVERSVFRRTGFIRLQEMPVKQDEALRRRLNSLVTTGDESGAADRLALKLRELKNCCRYHRTGLIPQTRQRLEELRQQLDQRQSLDARLAELDRLERDAEDYVNRLELHSQWLAYYEGRQGKDRLEQAQDAEWAARKKLEQCKDLCQTHPSRRELTELLNRPGGPVGEIRSVGLAWLVLSVLALAGAVALGLREQWALTVGMLAVAAGLACVGLALRLRQKTELAQREQEWQAKRQQWLAALSDWDDLERFRMEAVRAKQHTETVRAVLRTVKEPEQPDPLDLRGEETSVERRDTQERLGRYRQQRGECLGRMEHLSQAQTIRQQLEQTEARLRELERIYTALGYAQKALEEATQLLQSRYAPRITRRAEQILSVMTGGRYDRLGMDEELSLSAAAGDELTLRPSLWRSDGTVDQMYLALRIAVWEELMPVGILVLDDALVRFDEQRLSAAMDVLAGIAREKQVIVFMCR